MRCWCEYWTYSSDNQNTAISLHGSFIISDEFLVSWYTLVTDPENRKAKEKIHDLLILM